MPITSFRLIENKDGEQDVVVTIQVLVRKNQVKLLEEKAPLSLKMAYWKQTVADAANYSDMQHIVNFMQDGA